MKPGDPIRFPNGRWGVVTYYGPAFCVWREAWLSRVCAWLRKWL